MIGILKKDGKLYEIKSIYDNIYVLYDVNQSVYESDSDYAKDIMIIVKEKFKEGLDEREIKEFLTERYGEYILFKPYFSAKNLLLWLFPFILIIASMLVFIRNLKKK